jgi:hypothetical protein
VYESVVRAPKILLTVHWVLGIFSAISLFPLLPAQGIYTSGTSGAGLVMVFQTIFGWAPYLISNFYARSVLGGNYRAVIAFTIGAVLITGLAAAFYLNLIALNAKPSLILISVCVTIGLLAVARLCQMIWQRSALK